MEAFVIRFVWGFHFGEYSIHKWLRQIFHSSKAVFGAHWPPRHLELVSSRFLLFCRISLPLPLARSAHARATINPQLIFWTQIAHVWSIIQTSLQNIMEIMIQNLNNIKSVCESDQQAGGRTAAGWLTVGSKPRKTKQCIKLWSLPTKGATRIVDEQVVQRTRSKHANHGRVHKLKLMQ